MENPNQTKVSPKHVFLHLFAIIMLYSSAANFLTLIFQYINILAPDKLPPLPRFNKIFNFFHHYRFPRFNLDFLVFGQKL